MTPLSSARLICFSIGWQATYLGTELAHPPRRNPFADSVGRISNPSYPIPNSQSWRERPIPRHGVANASEVLGAEHDFRDGATTGATPALVQSRVPCLWRQVCNLPGSIGKLQT